MRIIAFDGPSACGKTTLLERVALELSNKGLKIDILGERNPVRDLFDKLQVENNIIRSRLPPLTESLFWVMNQAYRVETELPKKKGDLVLIDRYIYTPITYQYIFLMSFGIDLWDVSDYISKPFGVPLPRPNLSLILMAPLETLKQRFKKREHREMSQKEIELTEQALEVYKQLKKRFKNYYLINSNKPVEEIYKTAYSALEMTKGDTKFILTTAGSINEGTSLRHIQALCEAAVDFSGK